MTGFPNGPDNGFTFNVQSMFEKLIQQDVKGVHRTPYGFPNTTPGDYDVEVDIAQATIELFTRFGSSKFLDFYAPMTDVKAKNQIIAKLNFDRFESHEAPRGTQQWNFTNMFWDIWTNSNAPYGNGFDVNNDFANTKAGADLLTTMIGLLPLGTQKTIESMYWREKKCNATWYVEFLAGCGQKEAANAMIEHWISNQNCLRTGGILGLQVLNNNMTKCEKDADISVPSDAWIFDRDSHSAVKYDVNRNLAMYVNHLPKGSDGGINYALVPNDIKTVEGLSVAIQDDLKMGEGRNIGPLRVFHTYGGISAPENFFSTNPEKGYHHKSSLCDQGLLNGSSDIVSRIPYYNTVRAGLYFLDSIHRDKPTASRTWDDIYGSHMCDHKNFKNIDHGHDLQTYCIKSLHGFLKSKAKKSTDEALSYRDTTKHKTAATTLWLSTFINLNSQSIETGTLDQKNFYSLPLTSSSIQSPNDRDFLFGRSVDTHDKLSGLLEEYVANASKLWLTQFSGDLRFTDGTRAITLPNVNDWAYFLDLLVECYTKDSRDIDVVSISKEFVDASKITHFVSIPKLSVATTSFPTMLRWDDSYKKIDPIHITKLALRIPDRFSMFLTSLRKMEIPCRIIKNASEKLLRHISIMYLLIPTIPVLSSGETVKDYTKRKFDSILSLVEYDVQQPSKFATFRHNKTVVASNGERVIFGGGTDKRFYGKPELKKIPNDFAGTTRYQFKAEIGIQRVDPRARITGYGVCWHSISHGFGIKYAMDHKEIQFTENLTINEYMAEPDAFVMMVEPWNDCNKRVVFSQHKDFKRMQFDEQYYEFYKDIMLLTFDLQALKAFITEWAHAGQNRNTKKRCFVFLPEAHVNYEDVLNKESIVPGKDPIPEIKNACLTYYTGKNPDFKW